MALHSQVSRGKRTGEGEAVAPRHGTDLEVAVLGRGGIGAPAAAEQSLAYTGAFCRARTRVRREQELS